MNGPENTQFKKQIQPAMTITQQISNPLALGLEINNIEAAADFLNEVSYYRFIKAYSIGLKHNNIDQF